MEPVIGLDLGDLGWALGLTVLTLVLAIWQRLDVTRSLVWATGRSVVQLLVMGYSISFIFQWRNPWAVGAILLVMVTIAARVAGNRLQKVKGLAIWIWGSLFLATLFTLAYALLLIIQPPEWYDPRYIIPLTGMVLGNAMNSGALAGERLLSRMEQSQGELETRLCLGASPHQAIAPYRQEAIRASLLPTLNSMMVMGLVSLPGMFTGQVLGGSPPLEAASYQILIVLMIAFANLLSALLVTQGIAQRSFNAAWQLQF